jgi:hypothetical protein
VQPKSLCVDKAVVTNHHIEQCNTGLLTRDPVCLSRHDLAAMLALISHKTEKSAKRVPRGTNGVHEQKKNRDSSALPNSLRLS